MSAVLNAFSDAAAGSRVPGAPGLKARALGGAFWSVVGYGTQQALRLANNLILARLLFPEAFGLMSLTQVFVTGLEMLSEVGVGPAIIQGRRGDDPRLLDTAWTIQVVRGFVLSALAAILAWPVSRIYGEPMLMALLPVVGLGMVLRGFTSTRVWTLNRRVQLGGLVVMEMISQACSVAVTVGAAWILRSVWALVIGSLSGIAARVALSSLMLPGPRNRFLWDREAARELTRVGRWVLISTATTFFVANLDRLMMGRLLSFREMGVYTVALFLATAIPSVVRSISSRVFFPLLSETLHEAPSLLYSRLRKTRLAWTIPTVAALLALTLAGEPVVRLLYPEKFHEAGWMVSVLAAGSVAAVLNQATGIVWSALGEFRMIAILMVVQIVVLFTAMIAGHTLGGTRGLVAGVALVELVVYPVQSILVRRRGLWQPEVDLPVLAAATVVAGLALWN